MRKKQKRELKRQARNTERDSAHYGNPKTRVKSRVQRAGKDWSTRGWTSHESQGGHHKSRGIFKGEKIARYESGAGLSTLMIFLSLQPHLLLSEFLLESIKFTETVVNLC